MELRQRDEGQGQNVPEEHAETIRGPTELGEGLSCFLVDKLLRRFICPRLWNKLPAELSSQPGYYLITLSH